MKEEIFIKEAFAHYNYFISIAQRMTRNEFDAQDLVQDTYMRAYKFFNSFKPGSNSRAWIYKIMKNLFLNSVRKKNLHPVQSIEDTYTGHSEENEEPRILRYELLKLMEKTKDEHRAVLILFHLNDLTLMEISKTLNWPLGTVKSRLFRARKEFKKILIKSRI
jgi:RNA polymerase sigma-70 factor (ECF subfamily)